MSEDIQEIVKRFYNGLKQKQVDKALFAEGFTFSGPLRQFSKLEDFVQEMENMIQGITDIQVKGLFSNSSNQACCIYDVYSKAPIEATTRVADLFTIENGKIKRIEAVFDARPWEKFYT